MVETSQPNAECLYGIGRRDEVTHDDVSPNKLKKLDRKRLGKNKNRKRLDKKDGLLIRMYFPESNYNLTRCL